MLIQAIHDATMAAVAPALHAIIRNQTRLDVLLELLDERGIVDTAERAARWRARYESDFTPLFDGLTVRSEEQDTAYSQRFAEWITATEARERSRLGDELYETLRREADAMYARLRAVEAPPAEP